MITNFLKVCYEDIKDKDGLSLIQDDIICNICTYVLYDPLECSECRNCFCSDCIKNWFKDNHSCIYRCTNSKMIPISRILKNILSKIVIKCNKCSLEVRYQNYINHYNSSCTLNYSLQDEDICHKADSKTILIKNYIDKLEKLQLEKEAVLNMTFTMKKEMDELKNQNLKQHSEIMNLKSQYDIIKVNFYKIKEEKKQLEEELNKNGSSVDKKLKKKKK